MTNIKNSLAQQFADDEVLAKLSTAADKKYREHHDALKKSIDSLMDRTLTEFSLERNVEMRFTFTTQSWDKAKNDWCYQHDPHFYISHLLDGDARLGQKIFVNFDGRWIHTKKYPGRNIYMHDLDCKAVPKHINLEHLAEACKTLTEKTGCRVEHTQYNVVKLNDIKVPKTTDDLLVLHPGSRIAASGDKYYEGWDVADHWAIVQTRKAHYIVYYSTNGHGFGYDTVVMPDKSVADFYIWLANGDRNKIMTMIPVNVMKRLEAKVF